MKPNFFVVGAPKAGTTSLHFYLENHKEVFVSNPKELNYFSAAALKKQNLYGNPYLIFEEDNYLKIFQDASQKAIGEASVSYLFYEDVPKKIKEFNKEAKIIIVLRDPVQRAYSHYLMDKKLGYVVRDFKEIVRQGIEGSSNLEVQQYLLLGNYFEQVKRYLDVFDSPNVLILFSNDLHQDLGVELKKISSFLGISSFLNVSTSKKNVYEEPNNSFIKILYRNQLLREVVSKSLGPIKTQLRAQFFKEAEKPMLDAEVKTMLEGYYMKDKEMLSQLLSKTLPWD